MTLPRASVFDHGPDIDVSGFKPRTATKPAAQPEHVKAISETASFVSREPIRAPLPATAPAPSAQEPNTLAREAQREPREPRRHRTGRNVQFNIKARQDTIDRFNAIADRNRWVLGEAFERAVAALERTAGTPDSR